MKMFTTTEEILKYKTGPRKLDQSMFQCVELRKRSLNESTGPGENKRSRSSITEDNRLIEPIMPSSTDKLSPACERMIKAIREGLESGQSPVKVQQGAGGVYLMPNAKGAIIGVFKPLDEEPFAENNPKNYPISNHGEGLKKGIKVSEGGYREVATYILDHPITGRRKNGDEIGFAGVPPTMLVRCCHEIFNNKSGLKRAKVGSLQEYVKGAYSCEEMGSTKIGVDQVHMISVLDMRLANADRHGGNILYLENVGAPDRLVPIDHGYCLPESFEDVTFEWQYWRQAEKSYSPEILKYIESLNADNDIEMLKQHGLNISPESCLVLRISTLLLKKCAPAGLTPREIASIMCKDNVDVEASEIEKIIKEAQTEIPPGSTETAFLESLSHKIDSYIANLKH